MRRPLAGHAASLECQGNIISTGLPGSSYWKLTGRCSVLIGVKPATLRNWEQGRRKPTGPAKALLRILEVDPEGAVRALHPESA
jgi:hypothetical protein